MKNAVKRRPTQRDLLIIIGRLQNLAGHALARNGDRNKNRVADVEGTLHTAIDLCIEVRSHFPPVMRENGPWAAPPDELKDFT